ncbi:holo-ACP synthase [Parageobacillus thermoglucosidasius]|uniref:Holo-[acyl-carrier-protein] synthase n=1 Tax=Parageobacillus thermoglucosidasius TaxID=1426 RepID=A0AAN0YMP0_PARTM|nr:holo-ACP synthase [Parageobacillus thermoglucosidasius]AEH49457.1 Holo-(acyl-carrier-protein) synthase [Parageobacillus thermoglucosidasius C56-YS93]ALF09396.1 hypothetical protein AOT13_04855 [Parageobacillus thermoglucosidasius]ANZ29479.1 holo-[acyl-carrier-protein] synthase [Parageobacillus thermoglucosidasius]APM80217.1 holo-[acyl-carrier-protein] synthase [Parageobacillus thermoglucosidasius]KJX70241.1 hypothetical protein WH82_03480 [Parageobacillus thermoglucosidasius]
MSLQIFGTGIDIISTSRISRFLNKHGDSLTNIFTKDEIQYCLHFKEPSQCFAARFAAKEAIIKSMGIGLHEVEALSDIEVIHNPIGVPIPKLHGAVEQLRKEKGIEYILLSISHCEGYAVAHAMAVSRNGEE